MAKVKFVPLLPGACIGVVAPASPVDSEERLETALAATRKQGFELRLGRTVRTGAGFLAGADGERRADLEALWVDPAVDAVWCLRGGYGCLRLLSRLYYRQFGKTPKPLIGFSDISALQLALWTETRLPTFHGPVLTTLERSEFTTTMALRMLSGQQDLQPLAWPEGYQPVPIRPGEANGVLLGGNLATLLSMLGTRFLPDLEGAVVFLEEVDEPAYKIDRMLTQLSLAGIFDDAAAVLIGRSVPVPEESEADLIAVFTAHLQHWPCPSAYGFPIGHALHQWTLPQGYQVAVNTGSGELRLLESPFRGDTN